MSLQVWLPLTGHTNNQGLNNQTITWTTTPTYTTSGKLGQALAKGGAKLPAAMAGSILNNTAITIACWLYVNADAGDTANRAMVFGNDPMSSAGGRQFSIFRYPHADDIHLSWQSYNNGTYSSILASVDSGVLTARAWNHICVTYQNPQVTLYVNGAVINRYSAAMNASSFNFDTNLIYNSTSHYINDFRIYDHCLSQKEVHELAKALALHYKFDDPYVESTANLVPIPVDTGAANYAWDASLHVGARTVSGWGGGYNSGVGTPASGYHACWRTIENRPTMVYQNINSDYGMTGRWLGISSTACYPAINAGETYTISFEMMTVGKRQASFPYVFGGWYYKLTSSASSRSFHDGYFYLSNTKIGAWEKVSIVKTRASGFDNNTDYQAFYIYGQSSTEGIMYVRNVQVEKKDHATPYTGEAATSWNGTAVVYDSSGFGYNGTPTNLATHTPSARYTNCAQFNGVDSRVVVPYNTVCPENIFTVNLWWKKDALGSKGYETLFGGPSGFEMDTRAGTNTLCLYMASVRGGTLYSPLSLGQWYMFTMVRDGTNEFYYINGELVKTIDAKPMPVGTYFIGAWSSPTSQNYYGQISDFRLYGTALSAADVLELYHTEAAVGRGGEVFAREVIER